MLEILQKGLVTPVNREAFSSLVLGRFFWISQKERFPRSEWIHVRLALVQGLDRFNDLLPG
jgi:hypothetical protein